MSESFSTEPYKGVRDFYPSDWASIMAVAACLRETLLLHGYEEYNASPLERAELYETKTSEEIVNEQTYTFTDRGNRRVTLRPEMTPTLARMVARRRHELQFPLRWFSFPNVFRYERPQKGRLREHYQLNVDLVGVKDEAADIEIITLAHTLLAAFGATNNDFVIKINSRTLLDAVCTTAGLSVNQKSAYLRLLDKKSKISSNEYREALTAICATDPLELFASDNDQIKNEHEKLVNVIKSCAERSITNLVIEPTVVRGFDYYTGIVFEIYDTDISNPRALFGGGRYDNLIALFSDSSDKSIPAVGFGLGDVTLVDFLSTHNLLPSSSVHPEIYLGTPGGIDNAEVECIAEQLRSQKVRVFVNITNKSLGDQVRDAIRRNIPFFVAVGAEERNTGLFRIKRLSTGDEVALDISGIPAFVKKIA